MSRDDLLSRRLAKPPSTDASALHRGARNLRDRLTTPLGAAGLAVVAFVAGMLVTAQTGFPVGRAAELATRLDDTTADLQRTRGRLAVRHIQLDRLETVQRLSARHGVPADLAASVHDIARAEGLEPDLAFRLVEIESSFRRTAVSRAGAVGYTQIKPSTAAWIRPGTTRDDLFDTETNLRLGFRYLSLLLDRYEGDSRLALLAYNQGPNRVGSLLAMGRDPGNGYARRILTGLDD